MAKSKTDIKRDMPKVFFADLKKFNHTNFTNLLKADLSVYSPATAKCFSSAVTRFFIFMDAHPELTIHDGRILYYSIKLDLVAKFFADYPAGNLDDLKAFQAELNQYVVNKAKEDGNARLHEWQTFAV